jgi:surface polysaccharide O-acyltransferase-like enzyme
MHSCIFCVLGCNFFFLLLKNVCFLGNVKALNINDNLKEWSVQLDCHISHHHLGLFFYESFFVQFMTQFAFSIYNCPSIHESLCLFQGISLPVKCACGEEYKVCVDLCVRQNMN